MKNNFDPSMLGYGDCVPEYNYTLPSQVTSAVQCYRQEDPSTTPLHDGDIFSLGDVQNDSSFFGSVFPLGIETKTLHRNNATYSEQYGVAMDDDSLLNILNDVAPVGEDENENSSRPEMPGQSLQNVTGENMTSLANNVMGDLNLDDTLVKATLEAVSQGTLMPIIKEELKTSIQSRRLAQGRHELVLPKETTRTEQLTEEDIRKRQERRRRNKTAAQKCRHRKKQRTDSLSIEATELENRNRSLNSEVTALKEELSRLGDMFRNHTCIRKRQRLANESATLNSADG